MDVTNVMEPIVKNLLKEYEQTQKLPCSCQECYNDVLALTLNRIPPKYAATHRGSRMIAASYVNAQLKQDILNQISIAAQQVSISPRHTPL